ncbi:hypothetical protein Tco_0190202 [Tanacetum coccineum]
MYLVCLKREQFIVFRSAEYLEKKVSSYKKQVGASLDLEEIQEQNTQPLEYASERHNEVGHENVKAKSDVTHIHRSARIPQAPE